MEQEDKGSLCELIQERGERTVLLLEKAIGTKCFRYAVGERESKKGDLPSHTRAQSLYSIYAEYKDEGIHTKGSIPDFSDEKETAENFCRLLAKILATPLSLDAIYEDSVTP